MFSFASCPVGPCALTSVRAVTQCNSDAILVEWEMTEDTSLYLVTAEGHDQSIISCNSSSTSCELQDVQCDMQYSIIVSASSDKCSSLRSPPKKIKTGIFRSIYYVEPRKKKANDLNEQTKQTKLEIFKVILFILAPCVPDNVTVVPSCEENGATVMWARSPVATSYQLTATGRDGHVASCNTSVNNCTLDYLHCGQPYNFSITASGDNCTSEPRTSTFRTGRDLMRHFSLVHFTRKMHSVSILLDIGRHIKQTTRQLSYQYIQSGHFDFMSCFIFLLY